MINQWNDRNDQARHSGMAIVRVARGLGMESTASIFENASVRLDGWFNAITGFGTARDKTMGTMHQPGVRMSPQELEALYLEDDMAAVICDSLPDEAFSKGYELSISDEQLKAAPGKVPTKQERGKRREEKSAVITGMRNEHKRLCVHSKVADGLRWGRVFGGAITVIGANDGQKMDQPLNEDAIQSVDYLVTIDLQYVTVMSWYADSTHPKFGQPEMFMITEQVVGPGGPESEARAREKSTARGMVSYVHASRVLLYEGVPVTLRRRIANNGWGDSVLQRCFVALSQFASVYGATATLIADSAQAKFKIQGLIQMIARADPTALMTRMALVDTSRSYLKAILLDADKEDFERDPLQLTNLPETLDRVAQRLAATARMPVTKLMGMSPAGLNATGESDERLWHDCVRSYQKHDVLPPLERLTLLCFKAKAGPTKGQVPEGWSIKFNPLREPTALEQAELRKAVAETDAVYSGGQPILLPEEIALSHFTDDGYSPEYSAVDVESRRALLEADADQETAPADEGADPADPTKPAPAGGTPAAKLAAGTETEQPVVTPTSGDPGVPAVEDSKAALGGPQLEKMGAIVKGVAMGEIERESGLAQLRIGLRLTEEQALAVMGNAGQGFTLEKPVPIVPGGDPNEEAPPPAGGGSNPDPGAPAAKPAGDEPKPDPTKSAEPTDAD